MKRAAIFVALLAVPATAHAHLVQSGFGTFYDGAIHLVVTPPDVMVVIGLGLLAGLRGRAESRAVILALPCAWLVGGVAGMWRLTGATPEWLTVLPFGIAGVLVASDVRLPRVGLMVFTGVAGLTHGCVNGAAMASGGPDWLALVGVVTTALVLATLIASSTIGIQRPWGRIVVRVAGSWLAAISMLMAGWAVKLLAASRASS